MLRILVMLSATLLAACSSAMHRLPKDDFRSRILAETPAGTPIATVRESARSHDAGCVGGGITEQEIDWGPAAPSNAKRMISVCAGSGWEFPFRAHTHLRYFLDSSGALVDVEVLRSADGI